MDEGLNEGSRNLKPGNTVIYEDEKCTVLSVTSGKIELVTYNGEVKTTSNEEKLISEIKVISSNSSDKIQVAKERLDIIRPLLFKKGSRAEVERLANENNTSPATIYRWINKFIETGLMSSLAPEERSGGRGKSRLIPLIEDTIDTCIRKHYLSGRRKSVQKVFIEIKLVCKEKGIEIPHYNTVRRRISAISEYEATKHRLGKSVANKKFKPKLKNYPDSLFPLSLVQMDHTPLDIIVVDERFREPIGRPWLTLAIDTYSRMVVGYYIGFEKPNAMSVGLCVSKAILPKEEFLASLGVFSEWPCYGHIKCIHVDDAMEFRSKMLEDACLEYQIEINWRPVKTANYGGIIERLMGSFSEELHALKGTSFRSLEERGEYDSDKNAVFTYDEFEKWITILIVDVYHQNLHRGIGTSPISKWKEGIYGTDDQIGVGYQPVDLDRRKVLLDFMPFEWRTIQDYGVVIDGIYYYNDILRRWINSIEVKSGKLRSRKKFMFKIDPRNISTVYFLDPELKEYFPVTYRDTSKPPITKWELKSIREELTKQGIKNIDEDIIFNAYKRLKSLGENSEKKKKKARRLKAINKKPKEHQAIINLQKKKLEIKIDDNIFKEFDAFDDIDDGASRK